MQTSWRRHLRYANEQNTHHFWLCGCLYVNCGTRKEMKTQHRSNFGCIWWKWFKAHIYLKLHFRGKSQPCFHFIGCFSTTKVDIQFQCVSHIFGIPSSLSHTVGKSNNLKKIWRQLNQSAWNLITNMHYVYLCMKGIYFSFNILNYLGTDHLTWRGGGVMVFCFVDIFFFGQHES